MNLSTVSDNVRLEKELRYKIGNASAFFGKLQDRLLRNRVQSVQAALLYGAETWTVYCTQVKRKLMRQLRTIQNVTWQDKVINKEILQRANLLSMADILIKKDSGG